MAHSDSHVVCAHNVWMVTLVYGDVYSPTVDEPPVSELSFKYEIEHLEVKHQSSQSHLPIITLFIAALRWGWSVCWWCCCWWCWHCLWSRWRWICWSCRSCWSWSRGWWDKPHVRRWGECQRCRCRCWSWCCYPHTLVVPQSTYTATGIGKPTTTKKRSPSHPCQQNKLRGRFCEVCVESKKERQVFFLFLGWILKSTPGLTT